MSCVRNVLLLATNTCITVLLYYCTRPGSAIFCSGSKCVLCGRLWVNGGRTLVGGRRTLVGGRRTLVGGRRTLVDGRRTLVGSRRTRLHRGVQGSLPWRGVNQKFAFASNSKIVIISHLFLRKALTFFCTLIPPRPECLPRFALHCRAATVTVTIYDYIADSVAVTIYDWPAFHRGPSRGDALWA